MTATAACPWQVTGTVMGGCARAAVDSGTTITVCRKRFRVLVVSTRHGRVLRISAPCVGSRLTHQISPAVGSWRWRLGNRVVKRLPLGDLRRECGIGIGRQTGLFEGTLTLRQLVLQEPSDGG